MGADLTRPKLLSVDSSTECHTTPNEHALFMAHSLEYKMGMSVLEPHAGTGQLINGLVASGVSEQDIKGNELNISLCEAANKRFENVEIEQGNFLDKVYKVDRIVCNPPFKKIIAHMDHVLFCLNKKGIAICIVPYSYKKLKHEILEELPQGTFSNCNVRTKIIKVAK